MNLFPANNRVQVLLPELADESQRRKPLIEIDQELDPRQLPQIQNAHPRTKLAKPHVGIKRKDRPLVGQIAKRIAVQVISMSQISRKIRIRPVRRNESDHPSVSRY